MDDQAWDHSSSTKNRFIGLAKAKMVFAMVVYYLVRKVTIFG
jgi:hypothetical protein